VLGDVELLERQFVRLYDTNALGRQGNDIVTLYRSRIVPQLTERRAAAERAITRGRVRVPNAAGRDEHRA
jgi:hypothetical protein